MPVISERARRANAPACLRHGNLNGIKLMSRRETSNLATNALSITERGSKKIHHTRTTGVSR
jgi:hypothetical protein